MPRKKNAELENSPGRLRTGLTRGTKAIQPNTSGAAGRYRTAIEPLEIDKTVFQDPDGKRTVHWDIVQQMYVEGWPTTNPEVRYWPNLKELSEMTGINYQRIQNKSSAQRWALLQQGFKSSFINERKKRRIETLVNLSFDFDDMQLEVAARGTEMILSRQEQIRRINEVKEKQFEEALTRLEAGEEVENRELYGGIYHAEQEALAKAAALWQEIGMKALGTDKERIELTGADGGNLTVQQISSSDELSRPDTARLAAAIQTFKMLEEVNTPSETNLEEIQNAQQIQQITVGPVSYSDEVIDVEVEEDN